MVFAPLIALAGRPIAAGKAWRQAGIGSPATYPDALETAGGITGLLAPVMLSEDSAAERLSRFDGLLLIGGADIDPARYGQRRHDRTYGVDPDQDQFELHLLAAADRLGLATLCVCRGMQLLNVARGGTLAQHLNDDPASGDHGQPGAFAGEQNLAVVEGSLLAAALDGRHAPRTRCYHHQAVDLVAPGLRVTARAEDGVVEALEAATPSERWLLAVQWHPEDTAAQDPTQQAIFDAFVAACRG